MSNPSPLNPKALHGFERELHDLVLDWENDTLTYTKFADFCDRWAPLERVLAEVKRLPEQWRGRGKAVWPAPEGYKAGFDAAAWDLERVLGELP